MGERGEGAGQAGAGRVGPGYTKGYTKDTRRPHWTAVLENLIHTHGGAQHGNRVAQTTTCLFGLFWKQLT